MITKKQISALLSNKQYPERFKLFGGRQKIESLRPVDLQVDLSALVNETGLVII